MVPVGESPSLTADALSDPQRWQQARQTGHGSRSTKVNQSYATHASTVSTNQETSDGLVYGCLVPTLILAPELLLGPGQFLAHSPHSGRNAVELLRSLYQVVHVGERPLLLDLECRKTRAVCAQVLIEPLERRVVHPRGLREVHHVSEQGDVRRGNRVGEKGIHGRFGFTFQFVLRVGFELALVIMVGLGREVGRLV